MDWATGTGPARPAALLRSRAGSAWARCMSPATKRPVRDPSRVRRAQTSAMTSTSPGFIVKPAGSLAVREVESPSPARGDVAGASAGERRGDGRVPDPDRVVGPEDLDRRPRVARRLAEGGDDEGEVGRDAELVLVEERGERGHLAAVRRGVARDVVGHRDRDPREGGVRVDPGVEVEAEDGDAEERDGPKGQLDPRGAAAAAGERQEGMAKGAKHGGGSVRAQSGLGPGSVLGLAAGDADRDVRSEGRGLRRTALASLAALTSLAALAALVGLAGLTALASLAALASLVALTGARRRSPASPSSPAAWAVGTTFPNDHAVRLQSIRTRTMSPLPAGAFACSASPSFEARTPRCTVIVHAEQSNFSSRWSSRRMAAQESAFGSRAMACAAARAARPIRSDSKTVLTISIRPAKAPTRTTTASVFSIATAPPRPRGEAPERAPETRPRGARSGPAGGRPPPGKHAGGPAGTCRPGPAGMRPEHAARALPAAVSRCVHELPPAPAPAPFVRRSWDGILPGGGVMTIGSAIY